MAVHKFYNYLSEHEDNPILNHVRTGEPFRIQSFDALVVELERYDDGRYQTRILLHGRLIAHSAAEERKP